MEALFLDPGSKFPSSPFKSFQDYQKRGQEHQTGLGLELSGWRVIEVEGGKP